MVQTILPASDKLGTYEQGGTFVQWTDGTDAFKLQFATAWNFTPSVDQWDVDRIDSAAPIYTKITDVLGIFSFNLKNLISLYDTALPATDALTISSWIESIAKGKPPSIIFAPVIKAVDQTTNPFLNLIFTGRITSIPIDQVLKQGIPDVVISGEVIDIAQIRREATANEEG